MFDILINNCTILTMDDRNTVHAKASIGITDGVIKAVGAGVGGEARKVLDGTDTCALPGLVNCHTHVYQSLLEGVGYDMHFNPWNIRYLIPIISNMRPEHAGISAELAAIEMIKTGTTSFSDHWYLHTDFNNIEAVTDAFTAAGVRNHMVFGFLNESFAGRNHAAGASGDVLKEDGELLKQAEDFARRRQGRDLTTVGLGPGSTEDVGTELFEKIIELGKQLNLSVVTHIAGWVEIVSRSLEKYRMRDLEYAHSLGFTGEKSIAIHGVWLSEDEIALAADTGTAVAHNPVANMHLGYGTAPVTEMLKAGVKIGLGTDGAASYTYDMFEIGKTAAMLQKVRKMDSEALTAEQVLHMLTLGGAEVLGLSRETGSIEEGKKADLVLMEFNAPHLLKGGRSAPKIMYSARGSDVLTSIIDGKVIMENRRVLTLDEESVLARANKARAELLERGGEATRELLNAPWPSRGASWRMIDGAIS